MAGSPRHPVDFPGSPEQHWGERASCRHIDPNLFFPTQTADIQAAKRFCEHCQVQAACRDDVLRLPQDMDPGGIVGGLGPQQRRSRRIAQQRAADQALRDGHGDGHADPPTAPAPSDRSTDRPSPPLVDRPGRSREPLDRDQAAAALRLAEELTVAGAARRTGVSANALQRAWLRWNLGTPDTRAALAATRRRVRPGRTVATPSTRPRTRQPRQEGRDRDR